MEAVIVICVTVFGGGLVTFGIKFVDRKYNAAKEQLEKNSAEVDDMAKVVSGFRDLNAQLRQEINTKDSQLGQKDSKIHELEAKIAELGGSY